MIYYCLLGFSIILAVVKSSFVKQYINRGSEQNSRIFIFNLIAYGIAALIQLAVSGFPLISSWTILPAMGYAFSCYLMQLFLMKSMAVGSMALSSLFCMYGMLIPTLAGPIFFHESFSLWQGLGVLLMILSIFFSTDIEKKNSSINQSWLAFALLTLLFSGMVGVFEKIHQSGPDKSEIPSFLSYAFILIVVLNAITLVMSKKQETKPISPKEGLLFAILTGIVVVIYNRVNLTLAGSLDTMLYYPVANGGAILLTLLVSIGIFREPLRRNHILCFIFGISAILLLSIG